jgi:hypothetical protein
MNKKVIFPNTSMERIKTIIENFSSSFHVTSFNEEKCYITINQTKKNSTQVLKFHPSRTYLIVEDNSSLKLKRVHIFTNRENKHFLAFKYTNPIDFQIWVKEYTNAEITTIDFQSYYFIYKNNDKFYPLSIFPCMENHYCLYCLETGIISTVSSFAFNKNLH